MSVPALSVIVVCGERTPRKRLFLRRNFSKAALVSDEDVTQYVFGPDTRRDGGVPEDLRHAMQLHVLAARLRCGQSAVLDVEAPSDPLIESARALAESLYIPSVLVRTWQRHHGLDTPDETPAPRFDDGVAPFEAAGWTHALDVALDPSRVYRVRAEPLRCDQRHRTGVFHVISDVDGHVDALLELLQKLDYAVRFSTLEAQPPMGETLVLCGNLVGSGPDAHDAFLLVHGLVERGNAIYVPGPNEEALLHVLRHGRGPHVPWMHAFLEHLDASDMPRHVVREFLEALPSHVVLADGQLVVSSHRLPETMQGRSHRLVRQTATRRWRPASTASTSVRLPEALTARAPAASASPQDRTAESSARLDEPAHEQAHPRGEGPTEARPVAVKIVGQCPVDEIRWDGDTLAINTDVTRTGKLSAVRFPGFSVTSHQSLDIAPVAPIEAQAESVSSDIDDEKNVGYDEGEGAPETTVDPVPDHAGDDEFEAADEDVDHDPWDDDACCTQQRGWTSWWNQLATRCEPWASPHPLAARPSPYALPFHAIAYLPSPQVFVESGAIPAVFVLHIGDASARDVSALYGADGQPLCASVQHERTVLAALTAHLLDAGVFEALRTEHLIVVGTYAGPARPDIDATIRDERQRRRAHAEMQRAQRAVLDRQRTLHPHVFARDDVPPERGIRIVLERIAITDLGSAAHNAPSWHVSHLSGTTSVSPPATVPEMTVSVHPAPALVDVSDAMNDALLASFLEDPHSLSHARRVQTSYRALQYV